MREIQDHKDFSICSWYGPFEHITPKTVILELSEAVLKCFLFEEPSEDDSSEDSDGEETPLPGEFKEKLKNAFNTLGKTVFVKNNWHAPIDAKMFSTGNTLKAESADDIKLFFTTSTVIQKDLFNIKGIPFCLALRKWISIHPAAEFRCIVVNDTLRGITSRDWPTFYAHFKEEGSEIVENISDFFLENIKAKFPRKNYVVDIVLSYPDKPFILDFGPLNSRTNLYAFSWKEIGPLLNKLAYCCFRISRMK
uniref:Cell division cycle protein 123 homolog n=1 Tax=Dendroctonus ponderosae TaxID=77166 RepID=A0AAR5PX01_DENPD